MEAFAALCQKIWKSRQLLNRWWLTGSNPASSSNSTSCSAHRNCVEHVAQSETNMASHEPLVSATRLWRPLWLQGSINDELLLLKWEQKKNLFLIINHVFTVRNRSFAFISVSVIHHFKLKIYMSGTGRRWFHFSDWSTACWLDVPCKTPIYSFVCWEAFSFRSV